MDYISAIQITDDLLHDLYRHAREVFPLECCGWLEGSWDQNVARSSRQCENKQNEGNHPTAAARTAETAYVIEGPDLLEFNNKLDSKSPPVVIYHSHPNGKAYLSETDRQVATSPWGDGPSYPVQQLVIGIDAESVVEAALFAWSTTQEEFVEVARYPGALI
tara:strand:+ start:6639 stop:7124 length:486 start_codon:yes stop_codon:yes gene_type:complete